MDLKEKILTFMRHEAYRPLLADDLAAQMQVSGKELNAFFAELGRLEADAGVIKTRYGKYGLPEKMNLVVGRLAINHKGFGFVISENPDEPDVFISSGSLASAMHNDRVVARVHTHKTGPDKKREGEVIRIVERANQRIVGTFESSRNFGFVIPDDIRITNDIFIPKDEAGSAKSGMKVVAEIVKWPEKHKSAEGKIVEILGKSGDPGIEVLSILKRHNLSEDFPKPVLRAASEAPETISPEEISGRRDLRHLPIVTIDGEDAKDLDDAVYVERQSNGNYLLGVYIADVSHYVREGLALDKEARQRGTSVYMVDRVLPMLPPRLSNGICSLNAGQDRLGLSIHMEINERGQVVHYELFPAVIRVKDRLTYTVVRSILTEPESELRNQYRHQVAHLEEMERLCRILRDKRMRRGAIDFDFPEIKVKLDEKGKPLELVKRVRTIAESIIEEFMLAANEAVAEHLSNLKIPSLYRIHEEPESEKITRLNVLLHNFDLKLVNTEEVEPMALQKVLQKIAGTPEEKIISTIVLRSMKQARYEADNLGHFGLAAEYYTHFTSPIRRYPDLIVHRLVHETLKTGGLTPKRRKKLEEILPEIAFHSSERERAAAEAERESVDLKKVEYMEQFVGEEYPGIISGVTAFGLFIELENGVEGLVHVSSMDDDYYQYIEDQYALIGERSRKIYRLGDPVQIKVIKVNQETRTIDFALTSETARNQRSLPAEKKTRGRGEKSKKGKIGKTGQTGKSDKQANQSHKTESAPVKADKAKKAKSKAGRKPKK
ncbi:ribonuclease R [Acetonema longum]|uniref:Ribonuclease R n=1 Tax=Acetonema longum DSM 6540 TaxID=1009370 RepID=F7NJQ2_9FIRM|nr:ribonuclease R [Acetonema longum]EGO63708.1 Exoribonuclease R [Acetonema longum DSM 6540]